MGAASMPAPVTHRATSDSAVTEFEVAASGFWAHNGDADNIKQMNGGGNIAATYRLGSIFFVSAAVGGYGGSLKFSCDEDADCNDIVTFTNEEKQKSYSINGSDNYNDWLKTGEGKKSYGFWNLQERILPGIDANLGKYIILGVAGGIQAYQGDSDYDDVREDLGDIGDWVGARKYTYAHPTGFFLGVTEGDLISLGVFAGKQFVF